MWDPLGTPACWHGTTTVVIGNCGVGFAPLRPSDIERLAGVLESVEETPAASMLASLNDVPVEEARCMIGGNAARLYRL